MRNTKTMAIIVLAVIVVLALVAIKLFLDFFIWALKWVIILGIAAGIIYFVYYVVKKGNDTPKRNLR